METKQELVNNIKQWLQMDDEIKQLQKQINVRMQVQVQRQYSTNKRTRT